MYVIAQMSETTKVERLPGYYDLALLLTYLLEVALAIEDGVTEAVYRRPDIWERPFDTVHPIGYSNM